MIDLKKLTNARLHAYYKAERKRMYQHHRQTMVGEDQDGIPIMAWINEDNIDGFTEDFDRFQAIKTELDTRGDFNYKP